MRLAAQAKAGYYPVALEVVDLICRHLKPLESEWSMLDPCCGEGEALKGFRDRLSCPIVYGVELDTGRGAVAGTGCPDVLFPCDALTMNVSSRWCGLVYCNPPFDYSLAHGTRFELEFLFAVTPYLVDNGVLVAVVPESITRGVLTYLQTMYRDLAVIEFPPEHRPFKEVCILGLKRKAYIPLEEAEDVRWFETFEDFANGPGRKFYNIPKSGRPKRFAKGGLTDEEVDWHLDRSPLNQHFKAKKKEELARPILPLKNGHIGVLLAAGQLNGVVRKGDEVHVVRGSTRKETYIKEQSETEYEHGNVTSVRVESERVLPLIRTVWPNGRILTHE